MNVTIEEQGTKTREELSYMRFFDEAFARLYEQRLSNTQAIRMEVDGLISLLGLPDAGTVLDMGCGVGAHALVLAERGFQVTGLDLSAPLLQQARIAAQGHELGIRWVHQDMRTLPFTRAFDGIINIFSSFGYFEREDDNICVLQQVQQSLKPGGCFLLDTRTLYSEFYSRDGFLRPPTERRPRQICVRLSDDSLVLEETYINIMTNRRESLVSVNEPGRPRSEYTLSIRLYTPLDLMQMCEASGLAVEACFGGFNRSDYRPEGRLVLLCRKRSVEESL